MSVYYFSFMKLIVSTFLVYKVKKCLLKSGKVKEYCPKISPMFGHSLPALWAVVAQHRGCRCPLGGLRMPV